MTETDVEEVVNKADLYSQITEVHITNFMSFERATIHIPSEGIVGIKGYNDSGKSAVLRAIACCLLYKYSYNHKAFIKDGKNFFQVDVVFDDGVMIRYEKHNAGSSLYEMYENGDLLYTNKQQNGSGFYEKIIDVPEEIATYLGLSTTDEGMSLNYGLNTEKQLLVSTSGSENYAALNQVLRSQDLSNAGQLINKQNNSVGGSISRTEAQIHMKALELRGFDSLEEELIARIASYAKHVSRCERLDAGFTQLLKMASGLGEETTPELPKITAGAITKVSILEGLLSEVNSLNITVVPEIPAITRKKFEVIEQLNSLGSMMVTLREYVPLEIPAVKGIDRFSALVSLGGALGLIAQDEKLVKDCEHAVLQGKADGEALAKELEEAGHKVVTCGSCGELTLA